MTKKRILSLLSICILIGMSSCKSTPVNTMSSFYSKNVECVGSDIYGNEVIQTKVLAKSKKEAMLKAQDKALETILFSGIIDGSKDCSIKPLLGGANVAENNKTYFDSFFKKNGQFKKFVNVQNTTSTSVEVRNGVKYEMYSVEVKVMRKALENKLIKDNILIKKSTDEK